MSRLQPPKGMINHGLAFVGLFAFMVSFIGARIFTTINPRTWVIVSGIHFHHFWYGLGMVTIGGWLGIISTLPTHRRVYALIFGLGGGLIGDEVGLLLSGDYWSQLTYVFAVVFIGFVILILLLVGYRDRLEHDVMSLGIGERLLHLGIVITALSPLTFFKNAMLIGPLILAIGIIITGFGAWHHVRGARPR